jgi:hypothetical protein
MRANLAIGRAHLVVMPAFHPGLPFSGIQSNPCATGTGLFKS